MVDLHEKNEKLRKKIESYLDMLKKYDEMKVIIYYIYF